mmetsp:Transcript_123131/g.245121  ORF Transcript_123131/g.245121 Transcript_123131/m.245121 type:complete len:85 (-) Transcript_123131:147-401(-)
MLSISSPKLQAVECWHSVVDELQRVAWQPSGITVLDTTTHCPTPAAARAVTECQGLFFACKRHEQWTTHPCQLWQVPLLMQVDA